MSPPKDVVINRDIMETEVPIPILKRSDFWAPRDVDVRVDYTMVDNEKGIKFAQNGEVVFINKRKPFMRLCISRADANKIRKGREVEMYQVSTPLFFSFEGWNPHI